MIVNNDFKNAIFTMGKQIDCTITLSDSTVITGEGIRSVRLYYDGDFLTSIMKCCEIMLEWDVETNPIDYKKLNVTDVSFGVRANVNDDFEYVSFGNFIVEVQENNEDQNSITLTCYDDMLNTMIAYDFIANVGITLRQYIIELANYLEFELQDDFYSLPLANANKIIVQDPFIAISSNGEYVSEFTYRDVFDDIAEATGYNLVFLNDGKLHFLWQTATNEVIDEENTKRLTVGEIYGPINSLILSSQPQNDNLIYPFEFEGEKVPFIISNNQFMNGVDRDLWMSDIYDRVNGLQYAQYELDSFGICYLEPSDAIILCVNGREYLATWLSTDITITQGLNEKSYMEQSHSAEVKYEQIGKSDRFATRAILEVDKANLRINAVVEDVNDTRKQLVNLEINVDGINQFVRDGDNSLESRVSATEQKTVILSEDPNNPGIFLSNDMRFSKDGLAFTHSDSSITTTINNAGLTINNFNTELLRVDQDGVNAENLTARTYLVVGRNSRFEDFYDEEMSIDGGALFDV